MVDVQSVEHSQLKRLIKETKPNIIGNFISKFNLQDCLLVRQYVLAEIVDAFYRYEPMWNYRFLYKTIYLLEIFLFVLYPEFVSLKFKANIDKKLETTLRLNTGYLAYAIMGIIMADDELTDIILSKRFDPVNKPTYQELYDIIKSTIWDEMIPRITPYDLSEEQIASLKAWEGSYKPKDKNTSSVNSANQTIESSKESKDPQQSPLMHVLNIFNYVINASLQRDWCTITFTPQTLQYAALRLALKYFTQSIDTSMEVATRTLALTNSQEDLKIIRQRIEICCEILEEEMINTMRIFN
jgi:hypothetical protein